MLEICDKGDLIMKKIPNNLDNDLYSELCKKDVDIANRELKVGNV
jgi:hypothetical protein